MAKATLKQFSDYIVLYVSSEYSSTNARNVNTNNGNVNNNNKNNNNYVRAFLRVGQLWKGRLFRQCGTPSPHPINIRHYD